MNRRKKTEKEKMEKNDKPGRSYIRFTTNK